MRTWWRSPEVAALALALGIGEQRTTGVSQQLQSQSGAVTVESLVKLDNPWGMAYLPDGGLLITEKPGRLRIYANGMLSAPLSGVPEVAFRQQTGLLDVEVDPDFARNRYVYLSFVEPGGPAPSAERLKPDPRLGDIDTTENVLKGTAVARARLDGTALKDLTVIWRQLPKTVGLGHPGGRLLIADGFLFITSGDRQRFDPAQDMASSLGKVVRVRPDGSIPSDNPFASTRGARPDIWSLGHRNPLGIAVHPGTKQLWIHEMGPRGGDELNLVMQRRNYGWPIVSDGDHYDGSPIPDHSTRTEFQQAVRTWTPVISPSGFIFYTGSRFPSWRGHALLGGLSSKALIRLAFDGDRVTSEERLDLGKRIRDVAQAPDGSVMLLVDGPAGELLRLTLAGTTPPTQN